MKLFQKDSIVVIIKSLQKDQVMFCPKKGLTFIILENAPIFNRKPREIRERLNITTF